MLLPQVFENLLKRSIRFFDVCGKEQAATYEPQAAKKFFGAAVFQKCCRGVGEQPTFAKQIWFLRFVFPAAIAFFKLSNLNKVES